MATETADGSRMSDRFPSQVFDEVHDSIVTTDFDGLVTNWNRGAARIFGYEPHEAIGQHISFVYPEEEHAFLQESVIAPLKAKGVHEVKVRMRRRSGADFLGHLALSVIRDSAGEPVGMIGYTQDVTEQERAKEALESRLRQASAVARPVGQTVVHGGRGSQAGYTLESREPVIVEDLREEPRFSGPSFLLEHGVVSGISVVILGRDGPWGVLGAHTRRHRRFTEAGVDFLQSVANILAAAVQRWEAEGTLHESEQRFRQLAEHVEETFWLTDLETGDVLYVSPRFEEIWGRPPALLYERGEAWLDTILPEDRERVAAAYTPERLSRGDYDVEYRILRPDGSVRWIHDRAYPVKDSSGRTVRIAGVARDMTRRMVAQDALRRQSELLDIAHDAILVRDLKTGSISYWNSAAEGLYGWTREDAVGRFPEELLSTQYPQPLPEIHRVLEVAGHWTGELIQRNSRGETLVIHADWVLQRDQRGEPLAVMQLNERVDTEGPRAAAELQRLVALVDTSPVAIVTCDASGKVLFADREAWELFRLQPESNVSIEKFEEAAVMRYAHGEPYDRKDWPLRRALLAGEVVRAEEVTFDFADGLHVTALVNARPFYGSDGEITAAVAAIQDLSPIEQLEKMRSEFLGVVTHELKTPLTVIKGAAEFGLKGKEPGEPGQARELFGMIAEQSGRLGTLIQDLSDSAHIESGAFSIERELTNVCNILEETTRSFRQSGLAADIRVECPRDLPQVLADRRRISQVLHNLVSNAVKYSPAGSPVSVSAELDGLHLVVRVKDKGPGIPPEQRQLLFKRYSRLDSHTKETPGSGLGLYISKGIVEAHGGRIALEASGEAGSVFLFTLPLIAEAPIPSPVPSFGAAGGGAREVSARRVLVVDDDAQILRLLRRSLQESGYEPLVTSEPTGVLEAIESGEPMLVILDVRLPMVSGFDLLERIRQQSSVPVIMLTASDREEDVMRALETGADDYITKPFSPSELIGRIQTCIQAHAASPHHRRLRHMPRV